MAGTATGGRSIEEKIKVVLWHNRDYVVVQIVIIGKSVVVCVAPRQLNGFENQLRLKHPGLTENDISKVPVTDIN